MSVKFHIRPVYEVIEEELKTDHIVSIPEDYFTSRRLSTLPPPPTAVSPAPSTTLLPSSLIGSITTMTFPPPQEADRDIATLLSDSVAMEHLPAMAKLNTGGWSDGDAATRRFRQTTEFAARSSHNGAIYMSKGSVFAGIGGLRSIDWWSRSAEMGIIVAPGCWRRGISVDVHYYYLTFVFEELCLNRIEFKTASSNIAMISFCKEVLKATHDGTLRDAFPVKDTADVFKLYSNVELFSVLACEWPDLKKRLQEKIVEQKTHK